VVAIEVAAQLHHRNHPRRHESPVLLQVLREHHPTHPEKLLVGDLRCPRDLGRNCKLQWCSWSLHLAVPRDGVQQSRLDLPVVRSRHPE